MLTRHFFKIFPLLLLLVGCAEANSIHRVDKLPGTGAIVISSDAKQRFLLSETPITTTTTESNKTTTTAYRRFCAEPSPDVFSVLSQSASASGTLGLDKDAKSLNAALQAAFANSETGTTIPRTQTLNMLREMMYRTCERYLSGAITELELPIVAIRDQRVMVSILAIEQLTGAVTPKPVVISNGAEAGTGQNSTEMMKIVAKAHDNVVTAEAGMEEADSSAGPGGCAKLQKDKDDGKTVDEAKLGVCNTAHETLDDASAYYKAQVKTASTSQGVSSASATPGSATDPKDWTLAQAQAVNGVALAVQHIVDSTFQQDETQFFCFKQIADKNVAETTENAEKGLGVTRENSVRAKCLDYIIQRVEADQVAQQAKTASLLGLSLEAFQAASARGGQIAVARVNLADKIKECAKQPGKAKQLDDAIRTNLVLAPQSSKFTAALNALPGRTRLLDDFIRRLGAPSTALDSLTDSVNAVCQ